MFSSASIGRRVPSAVVVSARPISNAESAKPVKTSPPAIRIAIASDTNQPMPASFERTPSDLGELDLVARHEEEEAQPEARQRGDGRRLGGDAPAPAGRSGSRASSSSTTLGTLRPVASDRSGAIVATAAISATVESVVVSMGVYPDRSYFCLAVSLLSALRVY